MFKLLIFGGTTEGRLAAEFCEKSGIECVVSVATDYGATLLPKTVKVHIGRMDSGMMTEYMKNGEFSHIIDATHPYATEASTNIRSACKIADLPYFRLIREREVLTGEVVKNLDEAIKILNKVNENILCTLGSKNMAQMTKVNGFAERVWLRLLPAEGILEECRNTGFNEDHVILGKGPFSVGENMKHIQMSNAEILLTKESGCAGGYPEKVQAAKNCGIRLITISRPDEDGYSINELFELIKRCGEV